MPQRGQRKHHRGQSCPKNVATGRTQRQTQTSIGLRPEEQTFVLSRAIHAARRLLRASSATHRHRGQVMPRDIFSAPQARFVSLARISGGTHCHGGWAQASRATINALPSAALSRGQRSTDLSTNFQFFFARASVKDSICNTLRPEAKDKRSKQAYSLC